MQGRGPSGLEDRTRSQETAGPERNTHKAQATRHKDARTKEEKKEQGDDVGV